MATRKKRRSSTVDEEFLDNIRARGMGIEYEPLDPVDLPPVNEAAAKVRSRSASRRRKQVSTMSAAVSPDRVSQHVLMTVLRGRELLGKAAGPTYEEKVRLKPHLVRAFELTEHLSSLIWLRLLNGAIVEPGPLQASIGARVLATGQRIPGATGLVISRNK
jgi:hypothetical protein